MSLTDLAPLRSRRGSRIRWPQVRSLLPGLTAFLPWALPVALLLAWEAAGLAGLVSDRLMPRPSAVLASALHLVVSGQIFLDLGASTARALTGLALGGGLGFLLGLVNGTSRPAFRLTDTTLQMLRNIPHLALIPLVIVWFGIGEGAKLFLVALGTFFPIYLNTLHGIRSVDPQLVELGRSLGLSRAQQFRRIVLPGAAPAILVGLRYALGIMWLTLIVAETLSASSGLGYMAMKAREFMQLDIVILSILLYALLGKAADALTRALEQRLLAWSPAHV